MNRLALRKPLSSAVLLAFSLTAQSDWIRKTSDVMQGPSRSGEPVARLEAGSEVYILDSRGIWVEIQIPVEGTTGFVRKLMLSDSPLVGGDGVDLDSVASLGTGRLGSGNIVATTGARGLDAEQLRRATFDARALQAFLQLEVTDRAAKTFAKEGGLEPSR